VFLKRIIHSFFFGTRTKEMKLTCNYPLTSSLSAVLLMIITTCCQNSRGAAATAAATVDIPDTNLHSRNNSNNKNIARQQKQVMDPWKDDEIDNSSEFVLDYEQDPDFQTDPKVVVASDANVEINSNQDDKDDDDDLIDEEINVTVQNGYLIIDSNVTGVTNISLQEDMEQVAEYFGIDSTNPIEFEDFANNFGQCQFCDSDNGSGSSIDTDAYFANIKCTDWVTFSLFSGPEECAILRAGAVQHCGCKTTHNDENTTITEEMPLCDLCPNDSSIDPHQINMDVYLPTMSNELTCRDITKIPAVEGNKTCDAISSFGYVCGCPSAKPQCHVCSDGSSVERSNAVLKKNYYAWEQSMGIAAAAPGWDLTCAEVEDMLADNTKSACPSALNDFEQEYGVFIPAFCGCPNSLPPSAVDGGCAPCPSGYQLKDDDGELSEACLDWVTQESPLLLGDHSVCKTRQQDILGEDCCVPVERSLRTKASLQQHDETIASPSSSQERAHHQRHLRG